MAPIRRSFAALAAGVLLATLAVAKRAGRAALRRVTKLSSGQSATLSRRTAEGWRLAKGERSRRENNRELARARMRIRAD